MFVLFSSAKYIFATLFVGTNATVGTLYCTSSFLRPASDFPNSVAGSWDMGKFWYIAILKKTSFRPGEIANFRWIDQLGDLKNKLQDKYFAMDIFKRCSEYRNTRNLLFNREIIRQIKDWCTLDNKYLDEQFLEILRWEFHRNKRIVWGKLMKKTRGNELYDGWFLPHILERVYREKDLVLLERLKGIYPIWKNQILDPKTPSHVNIKYYPIMWDDDKKTWTFNVGELSLFNTKLHSFSPWYRNWIRY